MTFEFPQYTGVKIGDQHTLDDWGLLLLSVDISYPEPKTRTVEVLGGDGNIDLTDALGGVKFNNRTVGFEFVLIDKSPVVWLETTSIIRNYCHGKKMKVIMDTDPSHYWEGRIFVTSTKEDQAYSAIKIEVDAFPYKYDVSSSDDPWLWNPFSFLSGVIRTNNGYAGNGQVIDAVRVYYNTPADYAAQYGYQKAQYRVSPLGGDYYPWQYDNETGGGQDGYAGVIGKAIDRFQLF